jgi:hypothetical protein
MDIGRTLLRLRVILAAMGGGIVALVAVAISVVTGQAFRPDPGPATMLFPALGCMALGAIAAYVILRRQIVAGLRRVWQEQDPAERQPGNLIGHFQTLTVISAALAEGPSLIGAVIFLVTGIWAALFAPLLGLFVLSLLLPTRDRFERFAARVMEQEWR